MYDTNKNIFDDYNKIDDYSLLTYIKYLVTL